MSYAAFSSADFQKYALAQNSTRAIQTLTIVRKNRAARGLAVQYYRVVVLPILILSNCATNFSIDRIFRTEHAPEEEGKVDPQKLLIH